ncbi:MAG: hypothetical protein R2724_26785 [Bryobacterales bacterium]
MSRTRSKIGLKLYRFTQNPHYDELMTARTLERLRDIDRQYRDKGVEGLSLDADLLVPIGVEHDDAGKVTKNGYGVPAFALARAASPRVARRHSGGNQRDRRCHPQRPRRHVALHHLGRHGRLGRRQSLLSERRAGPPPRPRFHSRFD